MSVVSRFPRSIALALAALAVAAAALLIAPAAEAQVPPFKAWGSGLKSGEVVRAFKGTTQVGQGTANASGNWDIDIPAGGSANVANGDTITFTVDGRAAKETATFNVGQFVAPPGLTLTTPAPAATPTATATPAANPAIPANTPAAQRGKLASNPVFDPTGRALAVFNGGSIDQLATEAQRVDSKGIWVQASDGSYQVFVIGGPAFLNDQFRAKFPDGFPAVASVLLVK